MADRVIIVDVRRASEALRPREIKQMCVGKDSRILMHHSKTFYKRAEEVQIEDVVYGIDKKIYKCIRVLLKKSIKELVMLE